MRTSALDRGAAKPEVATRRGDATPVSARDARHVASFLVERTASLGATLGPVALTLVPGVRVGASAPATYVALGDSYSSGAGLGPFLTGPAGCDRSPRSYPELVGAARRLRLDFVACAGAIARD